MKNTTKKALKALIGRLQNTESTLRERLLISHTALALHGLTWTVPWHIRKFRII